MTFRPTLRPISLAVLSLFASLSFQAHADDLRRPYIVQLTDKPIASYTGSVEGLGATQPAAGGRLDLASTQVQLYGDYLEQKQARVQALVAAAPVPERVTSRSMLSMTKALRGSSARVLSSLGAGGLVCISTAPLASTMRSIKYGSTWWPPLANRA